MIQQQSILLPDNKICEVSELYYHKNGNRVDFNGYFNYFTIEKRKRYTDITKLYLQIRLAGYSELIIVHDGVDIKRISLDEKGGDLMVLLPYEKYEKGIFWFALKQSDSEVRWIEGCYVAETDGSCRTVNIGIDICTYRREAYVERNIKQLRDRILNNNLLEVSSHVQVYIVDNGNTLEDCAVVTELARSCGGKVRIIPNNNSGGAGGFTRGMLEVLKEKDRQGLTHVLLMDDDAVVEPDAVVRIYGFLCTVKEEFKCMTVGGAMLRQDFPYYLFCAGEWWEKGRVINPETNLDLREQRTAACDYLVSAGHELDRYSGWWCCCYSLDVVREDNLPVPLFFHHDDIEFGLRNSEVGTVFLNGVSVWHRGEGHIYPGVVTYYDIRNNLIEVALHQKAGRKKTAAAIVFKAITAAAIRMRYKEAALVYRGLIDFLKGTKWLYSQNPEELNAGICSMGYEKYALKNLKGRISEKEYHDVERCIEEYQSSFSMKEILAVRAGAGKIRFVNLITYNGWLLPHDGRGIKVLFPTDSPFMTYRKKRIVYYEPGSGTVLLTEKSYLEMLKIAGIYVKSLVALALRFEKTVDNYQKNIKKITNKKAWKEYLK